MSLTRDEWCKMWESVKTIEAINNQHIRLKVTNTKVIMTEIEFIKGKIQQVIGQME